MSYVYYNPNPAGIIVGDCVIRALAKVLEYDWDKVYCDLVIQGFVLKDLPSSNDVWGAYIRDKGFKVKPLPDTCPKCYTVKQFVEEHNRGTYILATGTHVVAVIDGRYYDTWDSGNEIPVYYFTKEEG